MSPGEAAAGFRLDLSPEQLVRSARRARAFASTPSSVWLDGRGYGRPWATGSLVALEPRPIASAAGPAEAGRLLDTLDRRWAARRDGGGPDTGLVVLAAYELFHDGPGVGAAVPRLTVLAVDRSVRFRVDGEARLAWHPADGSAGRRAAERALERARSTTADPTAAARLAGRPVTSLPRPAYLDAVARVREHIACGDVYQANLCQRFEAPVHGDPFELYAELAAARPAPRSAFVEVGGCALASISPETFVTIDGSGSIETRPIKGTRPRAADPASDRAAAAELLGSEKDAAELLMIVDLERNDLSRVSVPGSVKVDALAALKSFPTVHHMEAVVNARLRPGVGVAEIVRAVFPGGSITGAPKRRAMEILRALEPAPRGWFTGSLFWLGDDGSVEASILIRSLVFAAGRVQIGAGGGIVADSDPQAEWLESNHKARALAAAVGFDPVEAGR